MATVAPEILDDDVGAVGFERNTIVPVVNTRVLNYDVVGSVGIPSMVDENVEWCCLLSCLPTGVLGGIFAGAATRNVNVGEYNVA